VRICLRKALNDAVEDGLIRRNPAERIDTKPKDQPEMVTWSADELASFLSSAAQDQEYALYHIAAATGMRRGELLGLRWRDLDVDGGRVNVRQQYHGRVLGFCPPKSRKGVRTIEVDDDTTKLLGEHREAQGFLRGRFGEGYATALDLVFCRADGSPHDLKSIDDRFGRRVRQLRGLPVITLHGLRHTHATCSSRRASTSRR
jgi:integrase